MRFELAGSLIHPDPLVLRYDSDQDFDTVSYIDNGYTHFEVICIGGGGGAGGGIDTVNTGTLIRNYGGKGGGGGYQRVRGLLSALPDACPIVIGAGGSNGTGHASNPALTTDGGDGGESTFNNVTCRASGGKGGKRAQSNSLTVSTLADGGDGGIGNRTNAGGGGAGGVAGTPSATGPGTPGTAGSDGTLVNDIGKGGGGGAGGVGKYTYVTCNAATAGGRGSYNPGDTSVYGPGDLPHIDPSTIADNVVPGIASGAKASPLNGLPTVFGQSGNPGIVVIRLTALVITTSVSTQPEVPPDLPPEEQTLFGVVQRVFTFTKAVSGQITTVPSTNTYGAGIYGSGPYTGANPKQTSVAEISLASHAAPAGRVNHAIKIRAKVTSGEYAVIKAALYEGTTNRSGDLTTDILTTTLTDYTLAIPDAGAAAITSYANLSIKIWGYDPSGVGLVFQIAKVSLQLPSS